MKNENRFYSEFLYNELRNIALRKAIQNKDFSCAHRFCSQISFSNINFMKEVIKEHGTNQNIIKDAIEIIEIQDGLSSPDKVKLLNDTLKTPEYKKAFEAKQNENQDKNYTQRI